MDLQGALRDLQHKRQDAERQAKEARAPLIEVFHSVQGEGRFVGVPMAFLRVATCPLRCRYCDTPNSYEAPASAPICFGVRTQQEPVLSGAVSMGETWPEGTATDDTVLLFQLTADAQPGQHLVRMKLRASADVTEQDAALDLPQPTMICTAAPEAPPGQRSTSSPSTNRIM